MGTTAPGDALTAEHHKVNLGAANAVAWRTARQGTAVLGSDTVDAGSGLPWRWRSVPGGKPFRIAASTMVRRVSPLGGTAIG